MIVAVGDFNMGAMENKGLNIFNTKYVLASPDTSTDLDYANIEAVVGHEYFHNWTGNRVTCRDWFQLTLKEGLTVFRDQEFSADMAAGALDGRDSPSARAVRRIDDVRALRAGQFAEDAGPMAHPVRPESYQEISNFYTATVYEKGAEVIRMLFTLLGRDGFRAGMDEYFRRHDGQAVTCDDFVAAMESVYQSINNLSKNNQSKNNQSGSNQASINRIPADTHPSRPVDLSVFRRWYQQAGTPHVSVATHWDEEARTFTVTLRQASPRVGVERQGHVEKLPFHIPFAIGLLDQDGRDMPLRLAGEPAACGTTRVLDFTEAKQEFEFIEVSGQPVPSLLRNFSAPVIVDHQFTDAQLAHLSAHDSDAFNRWEAGQRLATRELVRLSELVAAGQSLGGAHDTQQNTLNPALIAVFRTILADTGLDPALKELALTLPAENVVGEALAVYDPQAVHVARVFARQTLARALRDQWLQAFNAHRTTGRYSPDPESAGRRAMRNCALGYLMEIDESGLRQLAWRQFRDANNMTARMAALSTLVNHPVSQRSQAIAGFYRAYRHEALVVDKWLRVQATARAVDVPVLDVVRRLLEHEGYAAGNPNKIYSLLGAFFSSNPAKFHRTDGAAYQFWADQVLAIDRSNPQVAARLARALDRRKKLTPALQVVALQALRRVHETPGLSGDVAEVIGKAVNA